jgi:hypothetical protein
MLMPDKHIGFAESLIGLGSFVLDNLKTPKDIDLLWKLFENARGKEFPAFHSFDNLLLAVDMLFAINAVHMLDNGKLERCFGEASGVDCAAY